MWHTVLCGHSVSPSEVPQDGDTVITRLSWADRMELEDEVNDELETTEEQPKGDKICLTKMLQPTEDFLPEEFNPINNASRQQLRQQFIVPDTPFTTAPRLDKMIADIRLSWAANPGSVSGRGWAPLWNARQYQQGYRAGCGGR